MRTLVDVVTGRGSFRGEKWETKEDWVATLKSASYNRVLYVFAKNLLKSGASLSSKQRADLEKIVVAGEEWLETFRRTIQFLNLALGQANLPFLIVKTFKYLDYVTFDVDVLVPYRQFQAAQKLLEGESCQVLPHSGQTGLHQRNCRKEGLLNIDLHRKFFWQGLEHIDLDFVWAAPELRVINGIECLCPSLEVDFLLHNKQLAYERYYITLLDFLAVRRARERENLDWPAIRGQVAKYRWADSYQRLLTYLNKIHPRETDLPYIYPYSGFLAQLREIIQGHGKLPLFNLAYYHFAWGRYYLLGRAHFPYYQHWFDFKLLDDG